MNMTQNEAQQLLEFLQPEIRRAQALSALVQKLVALAAVPPTPAPDGPSNQVADLAQPAG